MSNASTARLLALAMGMLPLAACTLNNPVAAGAQAQAQAPGQGAQPGATPKARPTSRPGAGLKPQALRKPQMRRIEGSSQAIAAQLARARKLGGVTNIPRPNIKHPNIGGKPSLAAGGKPSPGMPSPDPASTASTPPKAEDLARFTKGIPGTGKLIAEIHTTAGTFTCELFEDKTPIAVANFVGLARGLKAWTDPKTRQPQVNKPLYDGTIFHRVIPDFMIQGGDPLGLGMGGPGYKFATERGTRHSKPGVLSMANAGPGTNGSQFFITEKPTPFLDNRHTAFGQCEEVDLVKKIAREPRGERNRPNNPVSIKHIAFSRRKG